MIRRPISKRKKTDMRVWGEWRQLTNDNLQVYEGSMCLLYYCQVGPAQPPGAPDGTLYKIQRWWTGLPLLSFIYIEREVGEMTRSHAVLS